MTFSRFDAIVWSVATVALLLVGTLVWGASRVSLEVIEQLPMPETTAVSSYSQIRVTFDTPLVSLPPTAVQLQPAVTGQSRIDGRTLIFEPDQPLTVGTTYQVTIAQGITGDNGRSLNQPLSWQFQTAPSRVLYVEIGTDQPDKLFVADPSGQTEPILLLQSETTLIDYAVSPDGSRIAYTILGQDQSLAGYSDLWLMHANGFGAKKVLACPDASCSRPVWMPDGRRLLYERREIPFAGAPPGNPRLWWLDLDSGETVPLFQDNQLLGLFVTVSPDGRWLSFVSPTDQGIQLYNLEDGRGLLIPNRMGTAVSWSPDSQQVVMADIVTEGQNWSIVLLAVDVETGQSSTLSQGDVAGFEVDDSTPIWSPVGQQIAFGRKEARTAMGRQLWLMDSDGTAVLPLTGETDLHHTNYSWSPDGRYLLYQRYNLTELYAQPSVWLIDTETGQSNLVADPAFQPAWLP